jgi:single-strand DNA-binding protein
MATRSWNRVELIGNLTRDPELRYTPQGTAVVTFSIATNRTFISDGEKREEADFHRIVAWNKLAELCNQLLKKGNRVFVSGRLQNRSWEDQSGQTKNMTEIVIEDMILLTSRSGGEGEYAAPSDLREDPVPARSADEMPKKSRVDDSDEAPKKSTKDVDVEEEEPKGKDTKSAKEEIEDLDDLPF